MPGMSAHTCIMFITHLHAGSHWDHSRSYGHECAWLTHLMIIVIRPLDRVVKQQLSLSLAKQMFRDIVMDKMYYFNHCFSTVTSHLLQKVV